MRKSLLLLFVLSSLLASVAPAFAQRTTASVRGTVTDPSKAVVPGATVTVTNRDTGLTRAAVGGVGWEALSLFGGKTLLLISTIVLARILSPNDFGVVGMFSRQVFSIAPGSLPSHGKCACKSASMSVDARGRSAM